jgi:hypothetical protein
VQVRRPGARQAGDHDRRDQLDLVDLRVPGEQIGQQQPVAQHLQQLRVEVHATRAVEAVDVADRGEQEVESLLVVERAEVAQPGLGTRLLVQRGRVQRTGIGHRLHDHADLLDLGREPRVVEVVDTDRLRHGAHPSVDVTPVTLLWVS